MATEENTYFLRSFLLLVEGGLYISRETLGRECQKAGGNLDALLRQFEKKLKHEFHGKQYDKLFPQYGTTDIYKWDLQLSVGVLINIFGRSLSLTEKQKLRALRDLRNEIHMHCASASLDRQKYEEVMEELEDIINTLAASFNKPIQDRCSKYITQFATGPLDGVKPSLATLNGLRQTCQKTFKVGLHTELVVVGPSDYWINLCEHTLDVILNNADSVASEGAGFEEIEKNVKKMLEFLQTNTNVVFKGSKKACVILMFECNSIVDVLLVLQKLDSQEIEDHLSRISDALLRHYQFDATIFISARVNTECLQSILIEMLKMFNSEEVAHRHFGISSEMEEDGQMAVSKRPLQLDVECTSKSGLLQFLNSFKNEDFSDHLKNVADALSTHFGTKITLKASLDIDDVMTAIEEAVSRDSARYTTLQHGLEALDIHEDESELESSQDTITQQKKTGKREKSTAKWVYETTHFTIPVLDKQVPTASANYLSPYKPTECSVRGEIDEDNDNNPSLSFDSLLNDADENSIDSTLNPERSTSSYSSGIWSCSTSLENISVYQLDMDQQKHGIAMETLESLEDEQEVLYATESDPSSTQKKYKGQFLSAESSRTPEEMAAADPTGNNDYGYEDEDEDIVLRQYQQELAAPALQGKNVIIVAPSGYGKTRIVMKIIQEHIRQKGKGVAKVVFLVNNLKTAYKEGDACRELLEQYTMKVVTKETHRREEYLNEYTDKIDILIVTAQMLLDAQFSADISDITMFSLIVFDECHHTDANHTYNQIMGRYMDLKVDKPDVVLPQIVGLTASVGVGQARNEARAVEHIKHVMANLDAQVICIVQKNIGELRQHVRLPEEESHKVQRRMNDVFRENVVKLMTTIEKRMTYSSLVQTCLRFSISPNVFCEKGTFLYSLCVSNWLENANRQLKSDDSEAAVFIDSCSRHLLLYNHALTIYDDATMEDALSCLDEEMNLWKENTIMNENDSILYGAFKKLRNARFRDCPNPKLAKLYQVITRAYQGNFDKSRCIVLVKTIALSKAILSWMNATPKLMELNPILFPKGSNVLSKTQWDELESFRTGHHKLIIAVDEQLLNICECNFVIRYDHVADEIVIIQYKGGAISTNYFDIREHGMHIAEKEELNMVQEVMMRKAILEIQECIQERPDKFRQEIHKLQEERAKQISTGIRHQMLRKFEFRCIRCNQFICWSDDVKRFMETHVVLLSERISNCVYFERSAQKGYDDEFKLGNRGFCKKCKACLGRLSYYRMLEFLVLKIGHFRVVDANGRSIMFKHWKSVPFDVAPLSIDYL